MPPKTITGFFRKRKAEDDENASSCDDAKRPATDEAVTGKSSMSPAEAARAAASKRAALVARASKTGIPNPGLVAESWARKLKPEVNSLLWVCLDRTNANCLRSSV